MFFSEPKSSNSPSISRGNVLAWHYWESSREDLLAEKDLSILFGTIKHRLLLLLVPDELAVLIKALLQSFIESLQKVKISVLIMKIIATFFEQNKTLGKIKALFPPLHIIPDSLHPIKIAA